MRARALWQCVVRASADTIQHDGIEHAGYLAFLGLLALFPFLVFITAVAGVLFSDTVVVAALADIIRTLPPEIVQALEPRIVEITTGPPHGLITLAIVGAIWTASSAVEGLRTILNRAYRVHEPPRYVWRRLLSILQTVVFAFLLIVGMLLLLTLPALVFKVEAWLQLPPLEENGRFWSRVVWLTSLSVLLSVVGWVYYVLPNIRQKWVSVWPGALAVVALWVGAAKLFAMYLQQFQQVTVIYGSLGGIIAALLFFYLCNIIFIFGAELNHHISTELGMKVVEKE